MYLIEFNVDMIQFSFNHYYLAFVLFLEDVENTL